MGRLHDISNWLKASALALTPKKTIILSRVGKVASKRFEAGLADLVDRRAAFLTAIMLSLTASACVPYQYADNRPVRLMLTVNSPSAGTLPSAHR